jgi:hypothetical protein
MPPTIAALYRPATTALGQWPEICVFSRTRLPRSHLDNCPGSLRRRNPTPRILPHDHHASAPSHHLRLSNPHRSSAPHDRAPSCPRFPPLRLLGRLPPEPTPPSVRGRHPRTLNKMRRGRPREIGPLRTQNRTHAGRGSSSQMCQYRSFAHAVGINLVGPRAERPLSNVTAGLQTFIRRDGPSVFDPLLPFSVVSWLRQIGRMD